MTQERTIGLVVTWLLEYAKANDLRPTGWPINVRNGAGRGDQVVELSAVKGDTNADYEIRITVLDNGIALPNGLFREWDPEAERMTDWQHFNAQQEFLPCSKART